MHLVLLAVLLTLLPLEDAQGDAQALDDAALRALANDTALAAKIKALDASNDTYSSVVRLAWGALLLCCGDSKSTEQALDRVRAALSAGAVAFLGTEVMASIPMADEDEDIKFTAASTVQQLLMLLLEVAPEAQAELKARSLEGAASEMDAGSTAPATGGAMMVVDLQPSAHPRKPDSIATLLQSISVVLNIHPALFPPQLSNLLLQVGMDTNLMNVPSVFLGYHAVLSALATTESGAQMVFNQLQGDNAPPLVSWRRMFTILRDVIKIYDAPADGEDSGGRQQGPSNLVLPNVVTEGLCAFVGVFRYDDDAWSNKP